MPRVMHLTFNAADARGNKAILAFTISLKENLEEPQYSLFPWNAMRYPASMLKIRTIFKIPSIIANQCIFVGIFWLKPEYAFSLFY